MITEVKLNLGEVVFHVSIPFKTAEIAATRGEVLDLVGKAFDKSITDAKAAWKAKKRK